MLVMVNSCMLQSSFFASLLFSVSDVLSLFFLLASWCLSWTSFSRIARFPYSLNAPTCPWRAIARFSSYEDPALAAAAIPTSSASKRASLRFSVLKATVFCSDINFILECSKLLKYTLLDSKSKFNCNY